MGRWVLFDYGGVLCVDQPAADRERLVGAAAPADVDEFWRAYWALRGPYDQGVLAPGDYWPRVVGRELAPAAAAELDALDVAGWSHPYGETVALVERLHERGVGLALLSNCPAAMAEVIETLDWARLVPHRFYSCRLGLLKPDPAVYRAVLDRLGADPADVTFVDDRPANVAGAAAVGLRALHFTDPATLAADLELQGET
jgi:putative hydrolase of the HAD superfamily